MGSCWGCWHYLTWAKKNSDLITVDWFCFHFILLIDNNPTQKQFHSSSRLEGLKKFESDGAVRNEPKEFVGGINKVWDNRKFESTVAYSVFKVWSTWSRWLKLVGSMQKSSALCHDDCRRFQVFSSHDGIFPLFSKISSQWKSRWRRWSDGLDSLIKHKVQ